MGKRNACKRACDFIQLYVRLLETDENGYGKCCSCGYVKSWPDLNGGHWQAKGRNYNAAAFEESNVHIQCEGCNCFMQGNNAGYRKYMEANYPESELDYILAQSYKILDIEEIRDIARIYKQKCKDLVGDKNFPVKVST